MKIGEYRNIVDGFLLEPLQTLGFQKDGDHIFLKSNNATFAILRVRDKWSNITQQVKYLAVIRHDFLPNLENQEISGFVKSPSLYPFKVNPNKLHKLKKGIFNKKLKYKYKSCNLGHFDTLNINYGEENPTDLLKNIAEQVQDYGMELFHYLTPEVARQQIENYGKEEYIEKIWLESYAENIKS